MYFCQDRRYILNTDLGHCSGLGGVLGDGLHIATMHPLPPPPILNETKFCYISGTRIEC